MRLAGHWFGFGNRLSDMTMECDVTAFGGLCQIADMRHQDNVQTGLADDFCRQEPRMPAPRVPRTLYLDSQRRSLSRIR